MLFAYELEYCWLEAGVAYHDGSGKASRLCVDARHRPLFHCDIRYARSQAQIAAEFLHGLGEDLSHAAVAAAAVTHGATGPEVVERLNRLRSRNQVDGGDEEDVALHTEEAVDGLREAIARQELGQGHVV